MKKLLLRNLKALQNKQPSRLPFGSVMATAAASSLAGVCEWHLWVLPLLLLSIAEAIWISVLALNRYSRKLILTGNNSRSTLLAIGPPVKHSGIHTVPLGLAVIAGGLASFHGKYWGFATSIFLLMAWLTTLVCIWRFILSLVHTTSPLRELDGAWFLVPAAMLGTAMATIARNIHFISSFRSIFFWLATVAAITGVIGYWVVTCAAIVRIARHGFEGAPLVLWWISMGCAGLAAAALAGVLQASHLQFQEVHHGFKVAMTATLMFAMALMIPVLIGSLAFLLYHCRFQEKATWPPTFSTAVFAFGCLGGGKALHAGFLETLGYYAGMATVVMWTMTTLWNVGILFRNRLGPPQQ